MDTPTIPQKQCCKKSQCLHPQAIDGWLPETTEYFYANTKCAGGLNTKCKACVKAYSRGWYEDNKSHALEVCRVYQETHKEQRSAYLREYYARPEVKSANNKRLRELLKRPDMQPKRKMYRARRRALLQGAEGVFTALEVEQQYQSQNGKCWHCGKIVAGVYHVDHLIPLARGGKNDASNIVISCPSCNLSKGARLTSEWNGRLF